MTDEAIMDLYWQRREEAIAATEEKYGGYCRTIARRRREADEILHGKKEEEPQKPDSPDPF